jgi:hypothetical protein
MPRYKPLTNAPGARSRRPRSVAKPKLWVHLGILVLTPLLMGAAGSFVAVTAPWFATSAASQVDRTSGRSRRGELTERTEQTLNDAGFDWSRRSWTGFYVGAGAGMFIAGGIVAGDWLKWRRRRRRAMPAAWR